jgi:hypothetical protein
MRVCVYTAIFGDYDELHSPPRQSVPTDFICYTDSAKLSNPRWIVVRDLRLPALHPRLRAKWFKTHPHTLFPDGRPRSGQHWRLTAVSLMHRYDSTIWIDGSVHVKSADFEPPNVMAGLAPAIPRRFGTHAAPAKGLSFRPLY